MLRIYPNGPSAIIFIAISMTNKPLNSKLLYSRTCVSAKGYRHQNRGSSSTTTIQNNGAYQNYKITFAPYFTWFNTHVTEFHKTTDFFLHFYLTIHSGIFKGTSRSWHLIALTIFTCKFKRQCKWSAATSTQNCTRTYQIIFQRNFPGWKLRIHEVYWMFCSRTLVTRGNGTRGRRKRQEWKREKRDKKGRGERGNGEEMESKEKWKGAKGKGLDAPLYQANRFGCCWGLLPVFRRRLKTEILWRLINVKFNAGTV